MGETARGFVKGNIVILEEGVRLPDGAPVEIRILPKASKTAWGPFIGLWADRPEWDGIVKEIYRARTLRSEPPAL